MNGSIPLIVSSPLAPRLGRYEGGRSSMKSGTSSPVHLPCSASHQTYFLRSDQGFPSGSADARLYMIRRFDGQAHAHSGATHDCCEPGFLRAAWFTPPLKIPEYSQHPHAVEPSSFRSRYPETGSPSSTVNPWISASTASAFGSWCSPSVGYSHVRFLMGRSLDSSESAYRAFRRSPRWYMNHRSLRQSPGGSTAFQCHCTSRWVFVNDPSFSVCAAAGKKKTSVAMSSGRTSPRRISGASFQNSAVSFGVKSRITSHCSSRRSSRYNAPCTDPTLGFCPSTKYPVRLPSAMSATVVMWEWSPEVRGTLRSEERRVG